MKKKMMAAVLFCAMIFALSIPNLAGAITSSDVSATIGGSSGENVDPKGTNIEYNTALNVATLKLTVKGKPYVVLNPYSLSIDGSLLGSNTDITDQVFGGIVEIESKTEVPVIIGVSGLKGTPTTSTGVALASKSLADDTKTTTKSVFLYVSVAESAERARTQDLNDKDPLTGTVMVTGSDKAKANLYMIPKASESAPKKAYLTICGDAVSAPTENWADGDGVKVEFKLTAKMADAAATAS